MAKEKPSVVGIITRIALILLLAGFIIYWFGPAISGTISAASRNETYDITQDEKMAKWFNGGWDLFGIFGNKTETIENDTEEVTIQRNKQ